MHILPPHVADIQVLAAYTPARTALDSYSLWTSVWLLHYVRGVILGAGAPVLRVSYRDSRRESTSGRMHSLALFVLICAPA